MPGSADRDPLADTANKEDQRAVRTAPLTKTPRRRALFSTGVAAKECGVTGRTLLAWHKRGLVHPAATTLGGHFRWDIDELRELVHAYRMGPPLKYDEHGVIISVDMTGWPRPQGDEFGEVEPTDEMRAAVRRLITPPLSCAKTHPPADTESARKEGSP